MNSATGELVASSVGIGIQIGFLIMFVVSYFTDEMPTAGVIPWGFVLILLVSSIIGTVRIVRRNRNRFC